MQSSFRPAPYMRGNREASKNPAVAAHASRLLPYKQPAPVSPLECAVTESCVTAHSKQLTRRANFFRMRSYTKTGGEAPYPARLPPPPLTRKETHRASGSSEDEASFPIWQASLLRRMLLPVGRTSHQLAPKGH